MNPDPSKARADRAKRQEKRDWRMFMSVVRIMADILPDYRTNAAGFAFKHIPEIARRLTEQGFTNTRSRKLPPDQRPPVSYNTVARLLDKHSDFLEQLRHDIGRQKGYDFGAGPDGKRLRRAPMLKGTKEAPTDAPETPLQRFNRL